MNELTLTTPALLFSAISLILLAYTNRFLGYAQLIRNLYEKFSLNPNSILLGQINNLRTRLYLTRAMQILGVLSLFFCVVTMFLIYIAQDTLAAWSFGTGMILLIASLAVSVWEIQISTKALELHLSELQKQSNQFI